MRMCFGFALHNRPICLFLHTPPQIASRHTMHKTRHLIGETWVDKEIIY